MQGKQEYPVSSVQGNLAGRYIAFQVIFEYEYAHKKDANRPEFAPVYFVIIIIINMLI
jgi:hypothetical protein